MSGEEGGGDVGIRISPLGGCAGTVDRIGADIAAIRGGKHGIIIDLFVSL